MHGIRDDLSSPLPQTFLAFLLDLALMYFFNIVDDFTICSFEIQSTVF